MATPTRRDRRRERTLHQLTGAARSLIAEKGVAGLRIADVTETADVGRGSFYNHFESKEELVEAVAIESLATLAAKVLEQIPPDADPAERACIADRRFIRLAYDDPEFARLLANLNHGDDVFLAATVPYARAELDGGLRSGRFEVADVDVALIMLGGSAFAVMRAILSGNAPPDADQVHAESVLRIFGIDRDEARAISRRPLP